jgi:hypothetical protein
MHDLILSHEDVTVHSRYTGGARIALGAEGRLAALTADTAGAVRAYRHYLALRTKLASPPCPESYSPNG